MCGERKNYQCGEEEKSSQDDRDAMMRMKNLWVFWEVIKMSKFFRVMII